MSSYFFITKKVIIILSKYYPLHVHLAQGSIGDSILKIKDYVAKGKEYGLNALAVTDHGSLSAIYAFADECIKNNIKPIIGMEAYEASDISIKDKEHNERYHLVLLAKNQEGFKNLIKLHNIAATDGFYYKPRIDINLLKEYGKGLIGLSACIAGRIPQALLNNDMIKAVAILNEYKDCLDEFYLEIQPGHFDSQIKINNDIIKLSHLTNTPIVATNDIHYLNKEDAVAHNAHVLLGRKSAINKDEFVYPDTCYWFMQNGTLYNNFPCISDDIREEAIKNTAIIAEKCNVELSSTLHMPKYNINFDNGQQNKSEEDILYDLCYSNLEKIIQNKKEPSKYINELNRELQVIKQLGFCGYFLIVADYIQWAKQHNIAVGPGRGSAAGSLVSYLLGISKADPIKYRLMFERFLDPQRAAVPDIDIDFQPAYRDDMFRYAVNKYGYNNCALVSTFHIRKAKGAIRDAARVLGYEPKIGDYIAKLIPTVYYGDDGEKTTDLDIKTSISVSDKLQELSIQYKDIFDLAEKIEGLPSSYGIHAAGILISPISLNDKIPLIKPNKEGILATSLDLHDAEKSFVKFDMLALAYLDTVNATEKDIGVQFNYEDETLFKDEVVWNMIGSKHTTGIFQIASKTYKDRMCRLKPKTIEELATCLALVRGPCISTKLDEQYMQILEGKAQPQYLCEEYNSATKDTFGIPIFQEQIMKVFVNFGFSLSDGYKFNKICAKKKTTEVKQYKEEFINKALVRNIDIKTAEHIFDLLEKSALYSFNKSHAVSYALLSYCSAWLKYHYPLQYMKNLLTSAYLKQDKDTYKDIVQECRYLNIKFLPADINKSNWEFTVEDDKIRIGMCAIKGIGEKAFKHIKELRPFISFKELQDKVQARSFNKNAMITSIVGGIFDCFIRNKEFNSRLDMFKYYSKEPEFKISNKLYDISILQDDNISATIEDILCGGAIFINTPENNMKSLNWNKIKDMQTFTGEVFVRKVTKPKAQNPGTLSLITSNGDIQCIALSKIYERQSKIINGIRKKNKYRIVAIKNTEDSCYLQTIEKIA